MTTPIERAARAIGDEEEYPHPRGYVRHAQAAFESIDTDELRDEIAGWPIGSGYYGTQIGTDEAHDIALAVKNWLTGKDQP